MTDAFKAEHDVRTTPQIWLGDEHVGGFDALESSPRLQGQRPQ